MGGISKKRSSPFSLLLLSAAIIFGLIPIITCGGGGGGGDGDGGDATPPTVASTSPGDGATGLETNTPITVTFSEAMDALTLTTSTFTVSTAGGGISGAVTCSGSTATFTPSAPLASSTTFTATITTGVKDVAGNALANAYTWSFTTKALPKTRLFLSGTTATTRCATIPPGARGGLCPTNPIPANTSIQNFIYQGSPADWVTALADDLTGLGYGMTLELAVAPGLTSTGSAQIIIKKGAAETVLYTSPTFTVNSNTYSPFTYEGTGISAGGVSGDQLILRVTCLSGCSSSPLGLLLTPNNDYTSLIDVPETAVTASTISKSLEPGPAYEHVFDPFTGEPEYDPLTGDLVSVTK